MRKARFIPETRAYLCLRIGGAAGFPVGSSGSGNCTCHLLETSNGPFFRPWYKMQGVILSSCDLPGSAPVTNMDASCPSTLPYSCTNTTALDADLCCFEYPGGVVLQTQFWDYNPATGPNNSFTIHGLWPDNCDGTYEQYCDSSMEISNPAEIVASFDTDLLKYMQTYWKDYEGDDESLWEHEFNKHGTCYSTLKAQCYGENMKQYQNVFDYYNQTVEMFKDLPTFEWLAEAGIVPSETATYSKSDFLAALTDKYGAEPYIACDDDNAIQEVWYFHHVKGSIIGGEYVVIATLTTSGCSDNIKFPPKQTGTEPTTTTSTTASPTATPGTGTKGYITLSGQDGCLIKNGHWYVSGTCATYTLTKLSTGSVTLKSSAGYCTISNDEFTCSSGVTTPFEFNYDESSNALSANGVSTFSADEVPQGQTQEVVSVGDGGAVDFTLQFSAI